MDRPPRMLVRMESRPILTRRDPRQIHITPERGGLRGSRLGLNDAYAGLIDKFVPRAPICGAIPNIGHVNGLRSNVEKVKGD
jgi:hypothetical protein